MASCEETVVTQRRILLFRWRDSSNSCRIDCCCKSPYYQVVKKFDLGPELDHLRGCVLIKPTQSNHKLELHQALLEYLSKHGRGKL